LQMLAPIAILNFKAKSTGAAGSCFLDLQYPLSRLDNALNSPLLRDLLYSFDPWSCRSFQE
jgi:hypothetical protein